MRTVHQSPIYLLVRLVLVLAEQVRLIASIDRGTALPPVFHLNEVFDDRESIKVTTEPGAGAISFSAHGRFANHHLLAIDLRQVFEAHHKTVWLLHVEVILAFGCR